MDKVMLSDFGNWASIFGVLISVITFAAVLSIKKRFMFRSRVEEHADNLAKLSSEVSNMLNSYDDEDHQIYEAFALANVELRSIQKGASGSLLNDVKSARKGISMFKLRRFLGIKYIGPTRKTIRYVNTKINIVVAELQNVKKELLVGE